jgi:hypothetical protein
VTHQIKVGGKSDFGGNELQMYTQLLILYITRFILIPLSCLFHYRFLRYCYNYIQPILPFSETEFFKRFTRFLIFSLNSCSKSWLYMYLPNCVFYHIACGCRSTMSIKIRKFMKSDRFMYLVPLLNNLCCYFR